MNINIMNTFFLSYALRWEDVSAQPVLGLLLGAVAARASCYIRGGPGGSKIGAVAASSSPHSPLPGTTLSELLEPKCRGTVLELTRGTAESNCSGCCTTASNSAWRFSLLLVGTLRRRAVAIEARLSLAS